jgi:broad specificity phosphatase PhoE
MTHASGAPRDDHDRDLTRVSQELAGRLRARGVAVHDDDSPRAIVAMVEAVEAFERAVEARGGDLMMDEPPANHAGQPDDPHFLLPARGDDESFAAYSGRLAAATAAIRRHKPHSST